MSNTRFTTVLAVMSVFFIAMGIGTITPALQNIAEAFPHLPFSTILLASTLPSLFIIPATAWSGMVAGKTVSYRTLLIIGTLLFALAGAAPVMMNDFTVILVARALFGIGLGIISPLGTALILRLFEGQQRANMLGLSGVVMNLGGIVLQILGGILCTISWRYAFLPHLLGLLTLFMVLFMLPEPPKVETQGTGEKVGIPGAVYLIAALFGASVMLNYPMLVNMSTIIITGNLGDAAAAGFVLSMFTVGGMIGGAIFGKLHQYIKNQAITVSLLLISLGMGLVYYANSLMMLTAGSTLVGMGFSILMPAVMMIIGTIVHPSAFASASGMLMAFLNLGGFISTYYIAMLLKINSYIRFPIFVAMVVYLISAIIYAITGGRKQSGVSAQG
ncbi:Predicted arabinose efflux permease, MFS family [Caldanaerovirga acetigignens]|uniref:Predicted arabinose efflux permease, MFS family n=1 Tax=Caldanaerovirga acetigignens TaxID=447595 RepID=A0A1M7GXP4_9FIRM|nr:MFS transporter [Caldanaerovirga acetigignens]SHM21164.1 Predicted arabinose efflux permease, MFS family [Caldanaerovirga acetigignens]